MSACDDFDFTDEELEAATAAATEHERSIRRRAAENEARLRQLVERAKQKLALDEQASHHEDRMIEQRRAHLRDLERVKIEAELNALRGALAALEQRGIPSSAPPPDRLPPAREGAADAHPAAPVPTFKMVVDGFLDGFLRDKKPAMYKKHRAVLPMLLDVVGDKPVTDLRQADLNGFFSLLERLPPRWADECRRRNLTVLELAALDHKEALGPKSIEDSYKASVRAFLKVAKRDWSDQGFPTTLTTEGIEYKGEREEGEDKQRAFTHAELERLFRGPEMRAFASSPEHAHCYWLPLVGLFTGARVNEICQLNPQTDVLQEEGSEIRYLWITERTEADERITKSTKNSSSRRKVPIHSALIALGFLDYVEEIKRRGAKLLFPAWRPSRGRASGEAEKWFRQLLRDTGLRDETPGARLVGMHAFRHTIWSRASNAPQPLDAKSITGHAGKEDAVVRGYQGELSLKNKQLILEAIPFNLDLLKPAHRVAS